MSIEKEIELFEQYLNDQLSQTDRAAFDKKLKNNDQFKESFELHVDAVRTIKSERNKELKSFFQNIEKEEKEPRQKHDTPAIKKTGPTKGKIFNITKFISSIAAAIAIIVAATFLFQPSSSTDYADQYFSPYPNAIVKIERSTPSPSPLQEAMRIYQAEKYPQAITLFEAYLKEDADPRVRLYLAISLLAEGQTDKALTQFEALSQLEDFEYEEVNTWYLALSHLKENNEAKAKTVLQSIVNKDQHFKKKEAVEILNDL